MFSLFALYAHLFELAHFGFGGCRDFVLDLSFPKNSDVVEFELAIGGYDGETSVYGLSDDDPVKGILVVVRQESCHYDVIQFNGQKSNSKVDNLL